MKKQRWFLLLAAVLTALLLCGCSQYDDKYDDEDFLTDGANHYATTLWASHIQSDGAYALQAGRYSGVRTLRSFTVQEDGTLCEVTSTLTVTEGEAKLLVVNTEDKTLAVQWPLDSQEPLSVTLPAGQYELRIAGKSAGFKGTVSLILNGQVSAWDDVLKEMQASAEQALTGGWEEIFRGSIDSLREAFENEQKAA